MFPTLSPSGSLRKGTSIVARTIAELAFRFPGGKTTTSISGPNGAPDLDRSATARSVCIMIYRPAGNQLSAHATCGSVVCDVLGLRTSGIVCVGDTATFHVMRDIMVHPAVDRNALTLRCEERMLTASIHDLAVEVLQQIFAYACTDGGYTARSLALVSRHCYEVVQPLRLHNVALHSVRQIESFTALLGREYHPSHRAGVYHLFISTWRDGEAVARADAEHTSQQRDVQRKPSRPAGPHRSGEWTRLRDDLDKRLSVTLPRLLGSVAPDLRTLSIVHSWEFAAITFPACFPRLEEFTSFGPLPWLPGWNGALAVPPPCLPTARRAHLIGQTVSLVPWAHHAPRLTHLRLSEVTERATTLPYELQVALNAVPGRGHTTLITTKCVTNSTFAGYSKATQRIFPDLQHVRLEVRKPHPYGCSSKIENHNAFVLELQKTQSQCGGKLEVVQDRQYCNGYWVDRARQDWLDGVVGRPGCWTIGA
ncbi:hypothetical protein BD414DRAFT_504676 [Trametes punicea]|nr:hypothetical protein BD414DRAFT_504676 [Trametes punicea]